MKNEHTGSRKGLSASAGLHSTAAGIWHLPFSAVCCLRSSIHVSGRHSMHDPNSTHSRAANEGRCRRRHCIHGTSHYRVPTGVCQDKPANWPDLDTAEGVHGLWRDVAAHGGADDVVLHLLGLWAAQPERVLPAARAGAFPHLGPRGHGRLVDRLAARVHEVPGAGPLRTETARVQWRRAVTHANKHLKDNFAACKLHFPEGCISRRCGRRSCLNRQGPARVAPGSSAHAVLHKVPGEATSPEREAHPQPHPANKAQRMLAHLRV
ncbi:uncharacterized protein LOC144172918 isoform X3 [Haemaphysalis longicornis]